VIGYCITTFLRDELMYETVNSIVENGTKDLLILIGDQNLPDDFERQDTPKSKFYINLIKTLPDRVVIYPLPYDCGLSAARNFLVKKAAEHGCQQVIISADSIQLRPDDFKLLDRVQEYLHLFPEIDIVGFNLENRVAWEWNIEIQNGAFYLSKPRFGFYWDDPVSKERFKFIKCEVIKNFFLAKTDILLENPWDETLKLCEHEDMMYRLKLAKVNIYWTDKVKGVYKDVKPEQYTLMRQRMYTEFQELLKKKYNLTGWCRYEKGSIK
jgi:hypothetical protein